VVAYNLLDNGHTRFDAYAGVRVNSLAADLDLDRTGIICSQNLSGGTTYDVISHGLLLGLEYHF
jgi:hypothetical protein